MVTPAPNAPYYYGDFYKLNNRKCRSTLEIVDAYASDDNLDELLSCDPDIVVVMMNPGKSKPRAGGSGHNRRPGEIGRQATLVSACHDKSQNAIAKVMRCRGFQHVRVLNLSDVREVQSSNFLDDLKNNRLPSGHSVFCEERSDELQERLKSRSGIVIAAWGKDRRLRKLAKVALESFRSCDLRVHGWSNHPFFIHPARRSIEWPQRILSNWPC